MKLTLQTTREDHRIAWLAALAITIHIAESALPSPIPGAKPGLANIVTVICLMLYGWRTAAWVAMLRVLVGSILIGTFLSPTFVLSLSGAVASLAVLGLASRLPGVEFGAVGYSLLAAMAHMAAQFLTAWLLFIPHEGLWRLLPILMTVAVFFGITSGIIAHQVIVRIKNPVAPVSKSRAIE
jgi:heptaprenyl diphosphate synthase